MNIVKEHINKFERGLDPKDAMGIGKEAMDQKIYDAVKLLPIEASWIKYFPRRKTGRYIKIVIPDYYLFRLTAAKEIKHSIDAIKAPNVKYVRINEDGDVLIKLK